MRHRHLQYRADTPAENLPTAAIVDLLERGNLEDWRSLAQAVTRNPDGPLTRQIARIIDVYPMYGTSALWRAFLERCRARGAPPEARRSTGLGPLRRERRVTQARLSRRLGISQSDVSKLERRPDLRVRTLARYLRAIGGRLVLVARFGRQETEVDVPD